jgi:hypothetical protein
MDQLIRCINCDQVFHRTAFDQLPEYEPISAAADSFQTVEVDDYRNFLENHRGHRMEDLRIIEDSFVSEKPYVEPVKVSYFKATNGKESFVIRKSRKHILDPLSYDLIYGDLTLRCVKIEAQAKEIRKQMESELADLGLKEAQLDGFVSLCEGLARGADVKTLSRTAEEASNPLEIYYRMDDVSYATLLRNCRRLFQGSQFEAVQEFVDRHRDDGVLLLKATHRIELVEKAKTKPVPSRTPAKQKAMVKRD